MWEKLYVENVRNLNTTTQTPPMTRIPYFLLLLILISACELRVRQPTPEERSEIEDEIMALTNEVLMAAERADALGLFKYHSSETDFVHIHNGARHTRRELVDNYQDVYSGVEKQEIDIGQPVISVLSKDVVVVASQGTFKTFLKSGGSLSGDIAWTYVWERDRTIDSWRLLHAHQSFPGPPQSPQRVPGLSVGVSRQGSFATGIGVQGCGGNGGYHQYDSKNWKNRQAEMINPLWPTWTN